MENEANQAHYLSDQLNEEVVSRYEEVQRLQKSCRLCLTTEEANMSVFVTMELQQSYSALISNLLNISIQESDNLPKHICFHCAIMLQQFYRFKQKSELSQCTLNALLINHESSELICASEPDDCDLVETIIIECSSSSSGDFNVWSKDGPSEREANDTPKIQCNKCGKVFKRKSSLKQHSETHHESKKFPCPKCDQLFTRKTHVKIHMRRHNNEKPYPCEQCSMAFRKSSDLVRHKKVHSNRKDYVCETCGMAFKRSSGLSSHTNSHTGRRPYKCRQCPKTYSSHSSMMKHCRKFGHL